MAMAFTNIVKAQITQGLLKTLLERAGYRVTRLGVEELFAEITHLDKAQYDDLDLPPGLRYLPDLLVADRELNQAFLVEVKFRKEFNEDVLNSLYFELNRQRQFWEKSYAVILTANSGVNGGRFHQDYIRVVPPDKTEALNLSGAHMSDGRDPHKNAYDMYGCKGIWESLPILNRVFDKFGRADDARINAKNADMITTTIRDLKNL
jgi:hypothetical protein